MKSHVTNASEKIAIVVGIMIYIAAVIFLGLATDSGLNKVFIGLLPTLLYLITFFFLYSLDAGTVALWILPLIFPLIFIMLWYSKSLSVIRSMDGPVLSVVNIVLSYFINIFLLLILTAGTRTPHQEKDHRDHSQDIEKIKHELGVAKSKLHDTASQLHDTTSQLQDTNDELEDARMKLLESQKAAIDAKNEMIVSKENFNISLRSIEDKCKAINFVIGRVYSEKKGANEDKRSKLRIDSELYNSFSELTADFRAEDAEKLYNILSRIHERLLDLELPEKDIISLSEASLPVERVENDRVIDVLRKNDKDPVVEYHAGAKEICEKLMHFLRENYLHAHNG